MALNEIHVLPGFQPIFREIGLDAEAVFDHRQIIPWRTLPDRQNCTLDAELADGTRVRWHIKRYVATDHPQSPAQHDVQGQRLLESKDIPTAPLIAWGNVADGRSFVIFEDLKGYLPADKLLEKQACFDALLEPTADLAAKLHHAGLHHRDMYLCHFFARPQEAGDLRLIDAARVKRLPGWPMRQRWIVKDLAQFWYSTLKLPINDAQREAWLQRYAGRRGLPSGATLRPSILRKVRQIARHDAKLNLDRPTRNISIPR